jgi:DNA-binding PadR family transcriptional regulator
MLVNPLKRGELTSKALPNLRCTMPDLRSYIKTLENEGFIEQYQVERVDQKGPSPDWFALTLKGKRWFAKKGEQK